MPAEYLMPYLTGQAHTDRYAAQYIVLTMLLDAVKNLVQVYAQPTQDYAQAMQEAERTAWHRFHSLKGSFITVCEWGDPDLSLYDRYEVAYRAAETTMALHRVLRDVLNYRDRKAVLNFIEELYLSVNETVFWIRYGTKEDRENKLRGA